MAMTATPMTWRPRVSRRAAVRLLAGDLHRGRRLRYERQIDLAS
jgi:hypothetical protein